MLERSRRATRERPTAALRGTAKAEGSVELRRATAVTSSKRTAQIHAHNARSHLDAKPGESLYPTLPSLYLCVQFHSILRQPWSPVMQSPKYGRKKPPRTLLFSMPIWACIFALIISPLLLFFFSNPVLTRGAMETRHENKVFWITASALTVGMIISKISSGTKIAWPTHILCFLAFLTFAGVSPSWAFSPELSAVRFAQQLMVVACTILPAILLIERPDMLRPLFLCFAVASILNIIFIASFDTRTIVNGVSIGAGGYFMGKNYVGECAATAMLLSLHEMAHPGHRRIEGIVTAILSVVLLIVANSKTALGLAVIAPLAAAFAVMAKKSMRISPAALVFLAVLGYFLLAAATGFSTNRISYMLYGDSSFTGRQTIWDYAATEIARRPLFGWGYQSFWLVGPDGPSIVNGPGWVKTMPNAHNGYYDTLLEMGYIGLALLYVFLASLLHAIGRIADRDAVRAWCLLSLVFYVMMYNGLESTWMRGFEFLWVMILIVGAETARCLQFIPPIRRRSSRDSRHLGNRPDFPTEALPHSKIGKLKAAVPTSEGRAV